MTRTTRRIAFLSTFVCVGAVCAGAALAATVIGGAGNDNLVGTNSADFMDGRRGHDRLVGKGGDDRLVGARGRDRLDGSVGDDVLWGDVNRVTVVLEFPGNSLIGGEGDDTFHFAPGDVIRGGAGDDATRPYVLAPGSPGLGRVASASGDGGADRLFGSDARDWFHGGAGTDLIRTGRGDDKVAGGSRNDRLIGGEGDDLLYANSGVDRLDGGAGNDDMWALTRTDVPKPGADSLIGGEGDDTFHSRDGEPDAVTCGPGNDTAILDFVDIITDADVASPNGSCENARRAEPRRGDSRREDRLEIFDEVEDFEAN